ncbi:MAG TPA: DUF86 domain-containing protein [Armatimonadota bacterium]|nr:DUF86 domain-containing protein [Armatimonadota bacterium]
MKPRDRASLQDVLAAADHITIIVEEIRTKAAFIGDWRAQDIIVRELEIVGEAIKRLSPEFRAAHPAIPWKGYTGIRDVLAHRYDSIDLPLVWRTATEEIPEIRRHVAALLPEENGEAQ